MTQKAKNLTPVVAQPITTTKPPETIYIYRESGEISFKPEGTSNYTSITSDTVTVPDHVSVKTGEGRGYVMFPDNTTISLATGTEIIIAYSPTKVSIMQLVGSTYHRVTSLVTGSTYIVRTPNTLASVRGTKFAITYNPSNKKTIVAVTEHSVEVTQIKETGEINKAPVMIQKDSAVSLFATSTTKYDTTTTDMRVIVKKTSEVEEIKELIDENEAIDIEYDKAPVEGKRQLMEKIISSLRSSELERNIKADNQDLPETPITKVESRSQEVTRIVKKVVDKKILEDKKVGDGKKTQVSTTTDTKVETKQATQVPPQIGEGTDPSKKTTNADTFKTFKVTDQELSLSDQDFIDTFYTTYEKLFLVNDTTEYCKSLGTTTPKEMILKLKTLTTSSGYTLPKEIELRSLAEDLVSSCTDGSMGDKAENFKIRFDTTYPY